MQTNEEGGAGGGARGADLAGAGRRRADDNRDAHAQHGAIASDAAGFLFVWRSCSRGLGSVSC
eukprot:3390592-Rhodomonas_salina.2